MSVISDSGKTISSMFRLVRKTSQAGEHLVTSVDKLQGNGLGLINDSLSMSRKQAKIEGKLNMMKFMDKIKKKKNRRKSLKSQDALAVTL